MDAYMKVILIKQDSHQICSHVTMLVTLAPSLCSYRSWSDFTCFYHKTSNVHWLIATSELRKGLGPSVKN